MPAARIRSRAERSRASRPVLGGIITAVTVAQLLGFSSRTQLFGRFPYRGDTDEKLLALTFDDGPNEPYTSTLLDTLADRKVAATFFQVGRCAERYPEVTRRVVADGHVLGNHSYSHAYSRYLTEPRQRNEIRRAAAVLHDLTGRTPALYRPPWLCHWPWVLRSVTEAGLQVVSGTFGHPLEVFQPRPQRLADGTAAKAAPGAILIMHDGREARGGPRHNTVAAVGALIDRLRDDGYGFTTADRLLGVQPYA